MATAVEPTTTTDGWFNHGAEILRLLEHHRPKVCVEIGSWKGASAIPVARSIQRWRGALTCVDPWSGQLEAKHGAAPLMLFTCARNVVAAGVGANVRFNVSTSVQAARYWSHPIDYLYIDGDHRYESVRDDLEMWVPHVRQGGLIVGDDFGPLYPGLMRAWVEYAAGHGLELTRHQSDPPLDSAMVYAFKP